MNKLLMSSLVEQVRGVSYKPSDLHDKLNENSVTLLRANNIDDGLINFDDVVYVDRKKVSSKQYLQKGDILICASSGSKNLVGKAAQVDFDGEYTFGAFCKVVRPKNIDTKYLGMYFQSPTYRRIISSLAEGANINNIKNENIDNLVVNVPDVETIGEVTEIISNISSVIRHRKQELQKLDELIKGRFVEMFGDPLKNTKNWKTDKLQNLSPSKVYKGEIEGTNGKYWLLNLDMIESNTGIIIGKVMVDKAEIGSSTYVFSPENVLYSKLRPYLNKVVEPNDYGYATTELVPLHPKKGIVNKTFLANLLRGNEFVSFINSKTAGAKMPRVSMGVFWDIELIVPPIELQNQFADFVQQVDKSKVVVQEALDKAQLLFDSLMQEYFG